MVKSRNRESSESSESTEMKRELVVEVNRIWTGNKPIERDYWGNLVVDTPSSSESPSSEEESEEKSEMKMERVTPREWYRAPHWEEYIKNNPVVETPFSFSSCEPVEDMGRNPCSWCMWICSICCKRKKE